MGPPMDHLGPRIFDLGLCQTGGHIQELICDCRSKLDGKAARRARSLPKYGSTANMVAQRDRGTEEERKPK